MSRCPIWCCRHRRMNNVFHSMLDFFHCFIYDIKWWYFLFWLIETRTYTISVLCELRMEKFLKLIFFASFYLFQWKILKHDSIWTTFFFLCLYCRKSIIYIVFLVLFCFLFIFYFTPFKIYLFIYTSNCFRFLFYDCLLNFCSFWIWLIV